MFGMFGAKNSKQIQMEQIEPLHLVTPGQKKKLSELKKVKQQLDKTLKELIGNISNITLEFNSYKTDQVSFVEAGAPLILYNFTNIAEQTKKLLELLKKYKAMVYDEDIEFKKLKPIISSLEKFKSNVESSLQIIQPISKNTVKLGVGPEANTYYLQPLIDYVALALDTTPATQYALQEKESYDTLLKALGKLRGFLTVNVFEDKKPIKNGHYKMFSSSTAGPSVQQVEKYIADIIKEAKELSPVVSGFAAHNKNPENIAIIKEKLISFIDICTKAKNTITSKVSETASIKPEQCSSLKMNIDSAFTLLLTPLLGYVPELIPAKTPTLGQR